MSAESKKFNAVTKISFLPRYISAGVMLCIGVGLSVVASIVVQNWQQEILRSLLQKRSEQLAATLHARAEGNLEGVRAIGDFYKATSGTVTPQQFGILARNALDRNPSLQFLAWVPRIASSQRQEYERSLRSTGYPFFKIVEQSSPDLTIAAPSRPAYFPASYVEPLQGNEAVLGLDFGAAPQSRTALEQARDGGTLTVTGQLSLPNAQPGFAAIVPIYNAPRLPNNLQARRENLKGFVIGWFRLADFVRAVSENLHLEEGDYALYDISPDGKKSFLIFYESLPERAIAASASEAALERQVERSCPQPETCARTFPIANRHWSVWLVPAPAYLHDRQYWLPWTVFLGGSLASAGVAAYLVRFQRHASRIEVLLTELSQANVEIRLLSRLSDALQACLTLEEAYTVIPPLMQKLFPAHSGGLYMMSGSANSIEAVATWGDSLASQSFFAPNDCWALRCGREHLFENTSSGLACQHYAQSLPQESFCVPMMAQGETLGLLYLNSSERGKLTDGKQQLATTVSEHIAMSLANLRLRETLKHQSIRDPLTSLFNRRYMEEFLDRELHRAERQNQSVGIIMLDVDYFKQFNDTFGHEAGDTLLQELAMFLQGSIRGSDIACRYGGEEFLLILPEACLEVARGRAEQLREGVKHLQVQHRGQMLGPVSLSLGVAGFPEHGPNVEAVIQSADEALYAAKKSGRDRVAVAPSLSH